MKAILAVTVLAALTGAYFLMSGATVSAPQNPYEEMYLKYLNEYGKSYNGVEEYEHRLQIFTNTIKKIDRLATKVTHELGLN